MDSRAFNVHQLHPNQQLKLQFDANHPKALFCDCVCTSVLRLAVMYITIMGYQHSNNNTRSAQRDRAQLL